MPNLAKAKAKEIIEDYCFDHPSQIEPEEIANAEYVIVEREPLENYAGRITYSKNTAVITVNSNIASERQRFVTAHELGHFFADKRDTITTISDKYSFIYSRKENEKRANAFAAELLMPGEWYWDYTSSLKFEPNIVKRAAEHFRVSITASAIRYTEVGHIPLAVVMTQKRSVKWSAVSPNFPFQYIEKGKRISSDSYTYDYYNGENIPDVEKINATAWFEKDRNIDESARINEANIPMPNYNSVLTFLWEDNR